MVYLVLGLGSSKDQASVLNSKMEFIGYVAYGSLIVGRPMLTTFSGHYCLGELI